MADSAKLVIDDKPVELPLVEATQGNNGYDVSKLLATRKMRQ